MVHFRQSCAIWLCGVVSRERAYVMRRAYETFRALFLWCRSSRLWAWQMVPVRWSQCGKVPLLSCPHLGMRGKWVSFCFLNLGIPKVYPLLSSHRGRWGKRSHFTQDVLTEKLGKANTQNYTAGCLLSPSLLAVTKIFFFFTKLGKLSGQGVRLIIVHCEQLQIKMTISAH